MNDEPINNIENDDALLAEQQLTTLIDKVTPLLAALDERVQRLALSDKASVQTQAMFDSLPGWITVQRQRLREISAARPFPTVDSVIIGGALWDIAILLKHALHEVDAIGAKPMRRSQIASLDGRCGEMFDLMNRIAWACCDRGGPDQ